MNWNEFKELTDYSKEGTYNTLLEIIACQKIELTTVKKTVDYHINEKKDAEERSRNWFDRVKGSEKAGARINHVLSEMFEVVPDNWKQDIAKIQEMAEAMQNCTLTEEAANKILRG